MVRVIGLTGGIASGKSTVSNILRGLGAIIIDADEVARKIVGQDRPALAEIERSFGKEVIFEDGNLNRKKLGTIVFNDQSLLKKLNEITHPYIIKEIIDVINWYKKTSNNRVIILDAALLIEMDLIYLVEEVWLVSVPKEVQINRLIQRENISADDAKKRIDAQMSLDEKKQYAHIIIDNSKDVDYLKEQVEQNWSRLIE
ncbi:dephospho-CoA kinase [Alkaliphilus sp. MSJ-5]|uniref:Dephospho-CoA kinase n=1 Tax=Alkaliphilus flagellatus TaxID=2841507 RepID=A0ABS6G1M6_9FIRM|nr:dephospho-CoA kinase [Alkaliphilus flagellatus]MBU5675632.1 dephospho-CoA kinase [Alkaliphilus flagellatus]